MASSFLRLSLLTSILLCGCLAYEKNVMQNDVAAHGSTGTQSWDSRLLSLPPNGTGKPLEVVTSMYILEVSSVNSDNMEFTAQFYFRQKWIDPRLKSRYHLLPGSIDDPEKILSAQDMVRIWRPDLFFVEEREGKLHTVTLPNVFMRISPNGTVLYSVRLSMTFGCEMDLRLYPHDTQTCLFHIESYGYTKKDVTLHWRTGEDGVEHSIIGDHHPNTMKLPGFILLGASCSSEDVSLSSGNYSRLIVELKLQRKLGFFLTKLYVPYIILVAAAWLSFWIKPKSMALRLSLLMSILILMLVLSSNMNEYVPPAAYTKAIDVWTAFCISFVFTAFLEFLFVCHFTENQNGESEKRTIGRDPEGAVQDNEFNKSKVKDDNVSESFVSSSMFVARSLRKVQQWGSQADYCFRYMYSGLFVIFNLIYWAAYAS